MPALLVVGLGLGLYSARPLLAATVKDTAKKMGSRFEVTVVHGSEEEARRALEGAWNEIDRLEAMISSWRPTSETSAVNDQAGKAPVRVSPELFNLTRRALKVSQLTAGAFDLTFASLGGLWDFDAEDPTLPSPEALAEALARVDPAHIELDPEASTIFLRLPGVRIGFGAIGKGFAANRALAVLQEAGASGGLVNAGGDLVAFGQRDDGRPWTVGIADPLHRDRVFAYLDLTDTAVVTSGDYESFVIIDGKRYAHILDPRTGYPVDQLRSVTIVCPDAELADALATATFVLGPQEGMALVDRLRGVEALMVDAAGTLLFSKNLQSLLVEREEKSR